MADLVKGISDDELLEDAAQMYYSNWLWFTQKSREEKADGHESQAKLIKEIADQFYAKYDKVNEALYERGATPCTD